MQRQRVMEEAQATADQSIASALAKKSEILEKAQHETAKIAAELQHELKRQNAPALWP